MAIEKWRWVQKQDIGPSPRYAFSMAYDSASKRVILFGGADLRLACSHLSAFYASLPYFYLIYVEMVVGKVVISPGGNVYTVLGDLNRNGKAQNFENGADPDGTSGILRVTRDGNTVGTGILGTTHPLNKYIAYGIRNSFGIDFDPLTGSLWDTENGPSSNDELNFVGAGFNSGWEDIMGMAPAGFNFNNLVGFGGKGKYSNPEFVWSQVVAPTAIEFLSSERLGSQYRNDMFVGDFNKGRIYNFNLNSQRNALVLTGALSDRIANTDSETQSVIFGERFGGITDLKVGLGDGYLYVLSIGNGAVYRIVPNVLNP
jgi:aldose sugar dehydrogenase